MRGLLGAKVAAISRVWPLLPLVVLCGALAVRGQSGAIDPAYPASYFEFGMVVALGQRDVEVQTFDENKRKLVQHSFALGRETRADKVQVGDAVEVIYVQTGTEWTLRRLILLSAGIPMMGPPVAARGGGARLPVQGAAPGPATPKAVTLAPGLAGKRGSAGAKAATLAGPAGKSTGSEARGVKLPTGGVSTGTKGVEVPVALGRAGTPKVAEVVEVPLGGPAESVTAPAVKEKAVALERPSEECNRSAADWPGRALSLAVLDFRYPTEREESHDISRTGGGSGTAVADLVFARLEGLPEFALSRGDRQKLYRADFAGAARVGRQLGVDAVLAGTFVPVEGAVEADGFAAPRTWELRAGVVDTCTGQLLMRLYSETCAAGVEPGTTGGGDCKRYSVTAAEAADPAVQAGAFKVPLDALLYPLEHNGGAGGQAGAAGLVSEVGAGGVTVRLAARSGVKVGDVLAVHARRLAKNPTTYTLQNLRDDEIGRVTIGSVRGGTAVGTFAGDIPPRVGDAVEMLVP